MEIYSTPVCVCVCVCVSHPEYGGDVAVGGGPEDADEKPLPLLTSLPTDHDQPPREIS